MYQCVFFFFFKQKTAYEMRISDWSSDVCSSDLLYLQVPLPASDKTETQVGWPFAITPEAGARIQRRAPHIGEHSSDILRSLGFVETDIRHLIDQKIVHQPMTR